MSAKWSVWSWDAEHGTWMAVAEGTKAEMADALNRNRAAAAKHLRPPGSLRPGILTRR
jgi:hypothetical protein